MAQSRSIAEIRDTSLADALSERYLTYALSTITSRSLPDLRDGLKPVHRRLLYAMRQLRLDPTGGFKKCARVVGDVIGKYHPHGDQAVYDALVRLAQDFAVRYPLVDGQGNFGNIDGDNPAAMRYTEARLTEVAQLLLQGIDENAVDFRTTYDGEEEEPLVLPAAFPNLLANGAQGIAVGMATSIPPHNVAELCDALRHLLKHPNASPETLMGFIPGPDFPTGGVLVEDSTAVKEAYSTGRGTFRVRAKWVVEKLKGGVWQIVVTEIPYQVAKAKLIEKIAELLQARKLTMLGDIRDESTTEVRLVLEPKSRTVEPDVLMESLYRQTDLESKFSLNMNVLVDGKSPRVVSLREVLTHFIDHRREVLERRTTHRLERIARRLEVLEGYLAVYLNLDETIRIIRDKDEPKPVLMKRFSINENQANAILDMRLRSLRKLEEMEIRSEHKALTQERKELKELLASDDKKKQALADQFGEVKKQFGPTTALGRRRTEIGSAPVAVAVPLEAMVEREPITVLYSKMGWIRAVKGHLDSAGISDAKYKEGDSGRFAAPMQTTDKLLIFASNGRFYTIAGDKLPGGRGHGEPLRLMIDLGNDDDVIAIFAQNSAQRLVISSNDGRGFIVKEEDVTAQTRTGKQVLNLGDKARAAVCAMIPGQATHVAVIGDNRKLLVFPLSELPEMARGRGVVLQKYQSGGLSDLKAFRLAEGLSWQAGERTRTETDMRPWIGKRAAAGRLPPTGFPKTNKFS